MLTTMRSAPFAALALAAALAACQRPEETAQEPRGTAPAQAIDACRLFPQSEAAAIAGESVNFRTSVLGEAQGRDPLLCAYNSGTGDPPKMLSLRVQPADSPAAAGRILASGRSLLRAARPQDVPGLGDGAFWVGSNLQQLHVQAGDAVLIVTLDMRDGADHLDQARGVAARALERLAQMRPQPAG